MLAFYEAGFNRRDADAAVQFLGARYTQHNPTTADGVDGFRSFVAMQRQRAPESYSKIKRVFADGDYVI
ncbi:MAG TPA: nuclear transport factor 2 family protein, partial [Candidatus Elarobacter sp.]|nr:nuclear transport factor 2 family protein [Candidatus Elarobacter sp.]